MTYMPTHFDQKRQAERVPIRIGAQLREQGGRKYPVQVFDLSVSGCKCEALFNVNPGARVWVQMPGMASIECEVAWHRGFLIGCRFATPLHPATFDHLLKKH